MEATIKALATKDDLGNLRKYMGSEFTSLRKEVANEFGNVRNEMANIKYELSNKISDSVKWMFIFWIGQVAATLAIVNLFIKK